MIGTKEKVLEYLEKDNDDIYEIKRKSPKSLRSIAQNRYYHGVIIQEISNFHGYTPVETHELIKATVWIETTTWLDTWEFKFMCELIRDTWNTKFGVYIPAPNEVENLKSLEKYLF